MKEEEEEEEEKNQVAFALGCAVMSIDGACAWRCRF
jgi:hypothetical protein